MHKSHLHPVENAALQLADEIQKLADAACDRHDVHGVHYLVTEMRKMHNLARTMRLRGLINE